MLLVVVIKQFFIEILLDFAFALSRCLDSHGDRYRCDEVMEGGYSYLSFHIYWLNLFLVLSTYLLKILNIVTSVMLHHHQNLHQ
jgi:hypothetical protein